MTTDPTPNDKPATPTRPDPNAPTVAGKAMAGVAGVAVVVTVLVALPTALVLGAVYAPFAAWGWLKGRKGKG